MAKPQNIKSGLTRIKLYCMIIFASGERIAGAEVNRGVAQFGRAPRSGRGGRKFESCRLDGVGPQKR